jgi:hypothetical protein
MMTCSHPRAPLLRPLPRASKRAAPRRSAPRRAAAPAPAAAGARVAPGAMHLPASPLIPNLGIQLAPRAELNLAPPTVCSALGPTAGATSQSPPWLCPAARMACTHHYKPPARTVRCLFVTIITPNHTGRASACWSRDRAPPNAAPTWHSAGSCLPPTRCGTDDESDGCIGTYSIPLNNAVFHPQQPTTAIEMGEVAC